MAEKNKYGVWIWTTLGVLAGLGGGWYLFRNRIVNNIQSKTPEKALAKLTITTDACGNMLDQFGNCFGVCFLPCEASAADQQQAAQQPPKPLPASANLDDAFDFKFWETLRDKGQFTPSSQDEDVAFIEQKKINDALGWFSSDASKIYPVMEGAKTKAFVSLITAQYRKDNLGSSLYSDLKSFLKPAELQKVVYIVNNLPTV